MFSTATRISLKSILRKARPYRNLKKLDEPGMSIFSLERGATHWSSFSGGSTASVFSLPYTEFQLSHKPLAQEKAISRVHLPVDKKSLYRATWYRHTGSLNGRFPPGPQFPVDSLSGLLAMLQTPEGIYADQYVLFLCSAIQDRNKPLIEALLDMYEYPAEEIKVSEKTGVTVRSVEVTGGSEVTEYTELDDRDLMLEPLYTAIRTGNGDILSMLIDRGFKSGDISKVTRSAERHPLDIPIDKGDHEMVSLLLSRGAIPDLINLSYCLTTHVKNNDLLDILLPDWTAEDRFVGGIPLINLVVEDGSLYALRSLLDKWDCSSTRATTRLDNALTLAWRRDHRPMMELLVSRGATPGFTLVRQCLEKHQEDNTLLGILLPDWMTEGKAIEGIRIIHLVAEFGDASTLEALLDQLNNTSSLSTLRKTLLDIALRGNNESTKALLCSHQEATASSHREVITELPQTKRVAQFPFISNPVTSR